MNFLVSLPVFNIIFLRLIHAVAYLAASFHLLCVHQLMMGIWGVSSLGAGIMITLLWYLLYDLLVQTWFLISLGRSYVVEEFLDHRIGVFYLLKKLSTFIVLRACLSFLPDSVWIFLYRPGFRRVFLEVFILFSERIAPCVDIVLTC